MSAVLSNPTSSDKADQQAAGAQAGELTDGFHLIIDALNSKRMSLNGARVHLIGVAYKRDVNDLRESPALEILELLDKRGAAVSYTDPYVPAFKHGHLDLQSVDLKKMHEGVDCGVIVTDHKVFDYTAIVNNFPLLVDTRNALKGVTRDSVFKL